MAPAKSADVVFVVPADVGTAVVAVDGAVVWLDVEAVVPIGVVVAERGGSVVEPNRGVVVRRAAAGSLVVGVSVDRSEWATAVSVVAVSVAAPQAVAHNAAADNTATILGFSFVIDPAVTQELQESIEQPGRSRAQSGRLVA